MRSISPSSPRMPSPRRSSIACLIAGSARSRWWTISSLETVAAPWRANAFSAVLLPTPIPPVIATEIGFGRLLLLVALGRSRFGLGGLVGGRLGLLVAGRLALEGRHRRALVDGRA